MALPADDIVGVPMSPASVRAKAGLPRPNRRIVKQNQRTCYRMLFRFYGGLRWDAFKPGGPARSGPGNFFSVTKFAMVLFTLAVLSHRW